MDGQDLYAAVFTTAPIILLAVSRGLAFGPVPARARHREQRATREALTDVAAVVSIAIASLTSLAVLAGYAAASDLTRLMATGGAALAVLLAVVHAAFDIRASYASGPESDESS